MSVNEFNGELIVVGFSLTGATIEIGNGPVVEVVYSSGSVDIDQDVMISSYDVILGDPNGEEIPSFSLDGIVTLTAEPPVDGCTDEAADNYNPDANIDDGTCETGDLSVIDYCIDLHFGANLVSFYALPDDVSVGNMMSSLDGVVTGVIGEGVAASPNPVLGWVGSLNDFDGC